MKKLNPAFGNFVGEDFLYVLRFFQTAPLDLSRLVEDLDDVLFDQIGSSGSFRLAPESKRDLTIHFVHNERPRGEAPRFLQVGDNEAFVLFLLRGDSETTIREELEIIPKELADFCRTTGLSVEQVDVRSLYQ